MNEYQFGDSRDIISRAELVSKICVKDYRKMSDLEKLESTHAMLYADRRARSVSSSMTRYFNIHLIDEFKLDYHKLTYIFCNLAEQWKRVCCNQERMKMPTLSETQSYMKGTLTYVLKNLNYINGLIYDSLKSISNDFADVDDKYCSYADDDSLMKAVHDKRYNAFLASDYLKDRLPKFFTSVSAFVNVNGATRDSYEVYCNSIESCGNTLFNIYLDGGEVWRYMVEHRTEITEGDVISYFHSRYMHEEVQKRIKRFDYEEPCDARYKGMFRNKAAQELAKVFLKVFYNCIDKLKGKRYTMVLLAFIDMKIIEKGQYGHLFKEFVNREILNPNGEDLIVDNSTINKLLTKVKNSPFKTLTCDDLRDSGFEKDEFCRLSDIYWQCISIINLIFEEDLALRGFARYLCKPHISIPDVGVFDDILLLKNLLAVLRGEKSLI